MNKILSVLFATILSFTLSAQTDSLKITFDATLAGSQCQPTGVDALFMHSGVGTSTSTYYDYVVGVYTPDTTANGDTIGEMQPTGTPDVWEITINPRSYYSQAADGPIPANDTLYQIAMTFPNRDGTSEGKDDNCEEIYVEDLNTPSPYVTNKDGSLFDGVIVEWVGSVGVEDISNSFSHIQAFPNPVRNTTTIRYSLDENIDNLQIQVRDALGRKVATLYQGSQQSGSHRVQWDASNANSGVYFYTFSNGESMVTKKLMVIK